MKSTLQQQRKELLMKILHKIGALSLGPTLCLLLCLPYVSLASDMIAIDFTGTLIIVSDTNGNLDNTIAEQNSYSGSITYNTDLTDGNLRNTTWGYYFPTLPPSTFSVDLSSSYSVDATDYYISVGNDIGGTWDLFDIRQEGTPFSMNGLPGVTLTGMFIRLEDLSASAFASDALPGAELDLADFPDAQDFYIEGCLDSEFDGEVCNPATLFIRGSIDTMTVPEPTVNLMGFVSLGLLLGLAGLRSRKLS
jgi:hypothetical protein